MCDNDMTGTYNAQVINERLLVINVAWSMKIRLILTYRGPFSRDGKTISFKPLTIVFTQIKHGHLKTDKGWTFGGYSGSQTVHQKFIVKVFLKPFLCQGVLKTFCWDIFVHFENCQVPAGYPLEAAGPIFCAGVTMWAFLGISIIIFASGWFMVGFPFKFTSPGTLHCVPSGWRVAAKESGSLGLADSDRWGYVTLKFDIVGIF